MRIAVISDTHGEVEKAETALLELDEFIGFFHAGDFYQDYLKLRSKFPVDITAGVSGNLDPLIYPSCLVMEIINYKIMLVHGHEFNVKFNFNNLKFAAEEKEVDIVIFGHTHVAFSEREGNIVYFNPGSVQETKNKSSIGLIKLREDVKYIDTKIVYL